MNLKFNYFKNNLNQRKSFLIFIFIFSILVSSTFLLFFSGFGPKEHALPGTDYLNCYKPLLENLFRGKMVLEENNYIRCAIGYPLVLMPIFALSHFFGVDELILIRIFNVLMSALAACLLFLISESIFNKKIGLISALLWASYPFNVWLIKNPNTEVPFIMFFYLSIWLYLLFIKKRDIKPLFLTGFILGFAALIRPIGLYLIIIFFVFLILTLKEKRVLFSFILFLSFLILIVPWISYASHKMGHFVMVSSIGPSSFVDGFTFGLQEGKAGDRVKVPQDVKTLMAETKEKEFLSEKDIAAFVLEKLREKPFTLFKLLVVKSVRAWYATSELWWEKEIRIVQLPYLITAIVGIFLSIRRFNRENNEIFFILFLILYFWVMTIAALSIMRYMIPVMGFVFVFSAISILSLLQLINKKAKEI